MGVGEVGVARDMGLHAPVMPKPLQRTGRPCDKCKGTGRLSPYRMTCTECGGTFLAKRNDAKTCSGPCRQARAQVKPQS